jgi:DNA gyrase subunit A
MRLSGGAYVVGLEVIDDGEQLLSITERGFGKRTRLSEYPVHGRGGQGVKTLNITDRTGNVAAARVVRPAQELLLVTHNGIVIRTTVDSISLLGRNTQGVAVMRVGDGDIVTSIAIFEPGEPRQAQPEENGATPAPSTNGTGPDAPEAAIDIEEPADASDESDDAEEAEE